MATDSPLIIDPHTGGSALPTDTKEFTAKGAIVLSHFHHIAQKFNWSIRCEHCGGAVQGHNNGATDRYFVLRCKCTEYRCDSKDLIGRI